MGPDPYTQRVILRGGEVAGPGHAWKCPSVDILEGTQQGHHQYGADADWGVLDGCTLVQPGEYDVALHQITATTCFAL